MIISHVAIVSSQQIAAQIILILLMKALVHFAHMMHNIQRLLGAFEGIHCIKMLHYRSTILLSTLH